MAAYRYDRDLERPIHEQSNLRELKVHVCAAHTRNELYCGSTRDFGAWPAPGRCQDAAAKERAKQERPPLTKNVARPPLSHEFI